MLVEAVSALEALELGYSCRNTHQHTAADMAVIYTHLCLHCLLTGRVPHMRPYKTKILTVSTPLMAKKRAAEVPCSADYINFLFL